MRRENYVSERRKRLAEHFDFMLLDLIVLQLSFLVAFQIRHGMVNPYANRDYLALAYHHGAGRNSSQDISDTYEGVTEEVTSRNSYPASRMVS